MKNVLYKKVWSSDTNPEHVEPPPIPLIKEMCTVKPDKDYVKLKLRRYPMSDLYEFKMSLFYHGNP